MVKNKGLVAEAYEWEKEEVSSDNNEMVEVKVLMALVDDENVFVGKETDDAKVSIPGVDGPWLSKAEGFILPNHDTVQITDLSVQITDPSVQITDPSVQVTDSSVTDYDSANESLVCSTPLPPLEKLTGAEHVSCPKSIKSILKSNSTSKAKTLKGVTINEPTSAYAKGNKNVLASKKNSAPAGKLRNVKTEHDISLSIMMKELSDLKLQISKNQASYSRNNKPQQAHKKFTTNKIQNIIQKGL
nr:hypothetical protein [Tanacetum cinerariifolium]